MWPPDSPDGPLGILISGGIDSAVLLGEAARVYSAVHPIYIRTGSLWEDIEYIYLLRFLKAMHGKAVQPLTVLDMPVADLYPKGHWSLSGDQVPDARSPDEAVYLPGRNVLLLSKALIWCHLHGVNELAMATLAANPFPDATSRFCEAFAEAVGMAVSVKLRVLRPYAELSKPAVVLRGKDMPLEYTFSCIQPRDGRHCGACNKCAERRKAFTQAGILDPTDYARTC